MELLTNVYLAFKVVLIMLIIICFIQVKGLLISFKSSFEIQLLLTDDEMTEISNKINTREIGPEFHFLFTQIFSDQ